EHGRFIAGSRAGIADSLMITRNLGELGGRLAWHERRAQQGACPRECRGISGGSPWLRRSCGVEAAHACDELKRRRMRGDDSRDPCVSLLPSLRTSATQSSLAFPRRPFARSLSVRDKTFGVPKLRSSEHRLTRKPNPWAGRIRTKPHCAPARGPLRTSAYGTKKPFDGCDDCHFGSVAGPRA